ncbi:MAG: alginate lyase family protein, partial [Candidatus Sumerlaeota bacterium]|nr:alginate lyase family protein [Candidatus Sumerlaeota bacterium]
MTTFVMKASAIILSLSFLSGGAASVQTSTTSTLEHKSRGVTDQEMLAALDLERPELLPVREALSRDDIAAAKIALARHFQTRQKPVGPVIAPDSGGAARKDADEICEHIFRFVNCPPAKLERAIRWNEDPPDYEQWPICLNRHFHWITLARAYTATRDEKYAREFAAQVNGWTEAMPVFISKSWIEGPFFDKGKSPLSLDAGIRMAQTWWQAYGAFKDSPSFDVESRCRMLRSFLDHARYLMDARAFRPQSNWGAMETAGLFTLAVMLPEFKESSVWLRTAKERLTQTCRSQFYPDGSQIELATGYHWVSVSNYLSVIELARRNNVTLPDGFAAGLEKMFEYFEAIVMPDGRMPSLNDGGWGKIGAYMAKGFELFPQRKDFEFFATERKAGAAPDHASWSLPYAGWHVMRTGWGPDDDYLFFETGPYGGGHQHEDKLNILVHTGRKTILTEGGNYDYDQSDWRRYVLSTRAHNTMRVDGLDQNRRTHRETFVVKTPEDAHWRSGADFDYAMGRYDSGYGPRNEVQTTHTRQVLFAKPDYWIVVDTLQPGDAKEHSYEILFHLDANEAVVNPVTHSVSVDDSGKGLSILPLLEAGFTVEIAKGQTKPEVQGWLPTGQHNVLRPIPTAIFRWKSSGPCGMAFILAPRHPRQDAFPCKIKRLTPASSELNVEIALTGGGKDKLLIQTEAPNDLEFVRFDSAGKETRRFKSANASAGG